MQFLRGSSQNLLSLTYYPGILFEMHQFCTFLHFLASALCSVYHMKGIAQMIIKKKFYLFHLTFKVFYTVNEVIRRTKMKTSITLLIIFDYLCANKMLHRKKRIKKIQCPKHTRLSVKSWFIGYLDESSWKKKMFENSMLMWEPNLYIWSKKKSYPEQKNK